jgi:hypothetical protein
VKRVLKQGKLSIFDFFCHYFVLGMGVYQMFVKTIIFVVMLVILFSLGSGLIFLVKDKGRTNRTVKALTWRIVLSLTLFAFLFLAFSLGWINPHGV